jgi:hypothetical protein
MLVKRLYFEFSLKTNRLVNRLLLRFINRLNNRNRL